MLYALTNPQHLPWKVAGRALVFDVPEDLKSKNEVVSFANNLYFPKAAQMVRPQELVDAVYEVLLSDKEEYFPELVEMSIDC